MAQFQQGITQTLANVQGGGQVKALTLKTTGDNFIVVQDANGCATVGVAPKPSFKPCDGVYTIWPWISLSVLKRQK
jgi:hypothetical protein